MIKYVSENYVTWTCYDYEVVEVITRKSDGHILSEEEFEEEKSKKGFKISQYKIKVETRVNREEKINEAGEKHFIRDLFIKEYGELNDHKKWQQEKLEYLISPIHHSILLNKIKKHLVSPKEFQ